MTDQSGSNKSGDVREKIAEQAFQWLLELDDPAITRARKADFAGWLKESPVHVEELLTLQATWHALDGAAATSDAEIGSLIEAAKTNVVPLGIDASPGVHADTARWLLSRRYFLAAAAASLIILAASGILILNHLASETGLYVTGLGEQSSFTLLDGSVVHLNTRSKLRVRFTDGARTAELLTGEALFQVTEDPGRPFRVAVAGTVVEAVGTRFNVYRKATQTTVTVVEGKVAVSYGDGRSPFKSSENAGQVRKSRGNTLLLAAGEQVAIDASGTAARRHVPDTGEATAWRQRRLVFKDDALATVAEEFNRYNRFRIEVSGRAAARQLTGVFDADDPESMVEFLINEPSIRVTRERNRIVIGDR